MAAGAIPPPLFFERRRHVSILLPENGTLRNIRKTPPASITRLNGGRAPPPRPVTAEGYLRTWPILLPPRRRRARLPAAPSSTSRAAPRCAARFALSKRRSRAAPARRR